MRKRLVSMLIVMIFLFTAAVPAFASDADLYIMGNGVTQSTELLQGSYLSTLSVYSGSISSTDGVYYEVTNQNDELVYYGWLQPDSGVYFDGSRTQINGRATFFRNYWNTTPTTGLKLTMSCSSVIDASGYIEVH